MWTAAWRTARAIATPWVTRELAEARAKLTRARRRDLVIDRDTIDRAIAAAAPPGVPYDAIVLPASALAARFPEGPAERRGKHLIGKLRMTHRALPTEAVIAIALYSDVAADYFVESMAADVAAAIDEACGGKLAHADTHAGIPVVLKELAVAAGLGTIGKNSLFHSQRFGFHCKLQAVFLGAPVSRYDATPASREWKLRDCASCNLCVEACPVGAFDNYEIHDVEACDRVLAADFFGPRRDHMCRACITRCPVSNEKLVQLRRDGAPQRVFWDNEAQLALAADLFMYRPSLWVWLMQRFYYGAPMPGRRARGKRGITASFQQAIHTATSERTRDGWRLAATAARAPRSTRPDRRR